MNISSVNFNNPEEQEKAASINVKSNKAEESGKTFAAVVVAGISQSENKKMDSNTYNALLKDANDVQEQLKASATAAKSSFGALVKRLSGADYVKIDEDGYNLNDAEPEDMINIVERIKIVLATYCDDYVLPGTSVDTEKIQEVTGSSGMANQIADKMEHMNVPATEENVAEAEEALKQAEELRPLSQLEKNYMVKNSMKPTLENIYKAQHLGITPESVRSANVQGLTVFQMKEMEPQIAKIIKSAGLEVNRKNQENAEAFIKNGIPVTAANLKLKAELDSLELYDMQTDEKRTDTIDKIVTAMSEGKNASGAVMAESISIYKMVADSISVVNRADVLEVAAVVDDNKDLTIANIGEVLDNGTSMSQSEAYAKLSADTKTLAGYIQLQEIRILMTADAGLSLAKQGFNLDTTPIVNLVEELKKLYEQEMAALMRGTGAGINYYNDGSSQSSAYAVPQSITSGGVSSFAAYTPAQMVLEMRKSIESIKRAPDVSVGTVIKEKQADESITIADFTQTGNQMKQRFKEAGETYKAVGTEVRTDLGDSISKAVDSSSVAILNQLGLEDTEANRDAVRILGYNQMDITAESIANVKEVYSTLNHLIDNMKPETVLNMIRNNINPLSDDIHTVNEYLQEQNENVDSVEKYSRFLYKLERADGITEQEREQYIGIYKMLNIFKEDAGVAVGALLKQNSEITMENLINAYQRGKSAGVDAIVDDNTEMTQYSDTVNYYKNLFDSTADHITPDTLKKTNAKQPVLKQQAEQFCENINNSYDIAAEAEYYKDYTEKIKDVLQSEDNIIRELSKNDMKFTINNISAMENIMSSGYFNKIYDAADKNKRNDIKEKLDGMLEKSESREALNNAYSDLAEKIDTMSEEVLLSDEVQEYKDIESLRMLGKEIGMLNNMAQMNHYKIPFVAEGEIGTINLSIIQDEQNKGRISIEFETTAQGKVSVEAKASIDAEGDGSMSVNLTAVFERQSEEADEKMLKVKNKLSSMGYSRCGMNLCYSPVVPEISYNNKLGDIPSDKLYETAKNIIIGLL